MIFHSIEEPARKTNQRQIQYSINENGCHECTSHSKDRDGYPQIERNRKHWRMSRYLYSLLVGEIPEGLVVRHICDNPACINPDHLELGNTADNNQDKVQRGRQAKGESHGSAKLTTEAVMYIRQKADERTSRLAEQFGVSPGTISDIRSGRRWGHI